MFEDIIAFCHIVEHKSLTKAASALGVSAPVVTRRLARLEQSLNTRLFQRTTRQIYLTEAGELFFSQITDVLNGLEASKESVRNLSNIVSGTLKVGLPASISHLYVTKMLHQFTAQYPQIQIHIVTGSNLLSLLSSGFDLVIHAGVLPDSNFYYKKIGSWKKIFCASPDYLRQYGVPQMPAELNTHQCIDHYDNLGRTWDYKDKGVLKKILVNSKIRVDSQFDMRQLALSGVGIAYLSQCTVHEDLKLGHLISILEDFQASGLETYAVYPSKKFISKKTEVFLAFIESVYGQMNNDLFTTP